MSSRITDNSLPCGWCHATIGDLIAPFENANPAHSDRDTFQYVDIDAIDNGEHRITNAKGLPTSKAPSRARKVIRKGDVLISLVRPYLKNIAIIPEELDEQWASTAFCVCRPRPDIDSRFFYYMFLQNDFLNALPTYGDSPPSGHDDDLLATTISLPPADEIVRIADRIDELFTDLSAGVAALERVKRNLSRYRAAVLHAAVTGRLTEAWRKEHGPADEPGPKLLERILAERRRQWEQRTLAKYEKNGKKPPNGWRSRYLEPAPPKPLANDAPLPTLPEGWCWVSGDQVLGVLRSGTTAVPVDDPTSLRILRSSAVRPGRIDLSDFRYLPDGTHVDEADHVQPNDLFFVRLSGSLYLAGACAWVDSTVPKNLIYPDRLFAARCVVPSMACLLEIVFQSRLARDRIEPKAKSTAGHQRISMGAVLEQPIPFPSLAEQAAIVEAVSEKLSQIDALEAEVERGLTRAGRLRQAILKAAFEGKLVPQDPSDEPASILLDRIRDAAPSVEPKHTRKPRRKSAGKVTAS